MNISSPSVDHPTSETDWVIGLAHSELNITKSGVFDLTSFESTKEELRSSSVALLKSIKHKTIEHVVLFNNEISKESSGNDIKVFSISNTDCDFMLFRHGQKLIFSLKEVGHVEVSQIAPGPNILNGQNHSINCIYKILASTGVYGNIEWKFKDNKLNIPLFIKLVLSNYIKSTII